MKEKNVTLLDYLDHAERLADYMNAVYFEGEQVIQPEWILTENSVVYRFQGYAAKISAQEFNRDILSRLVMGNQYVLIGIEAQSAVDYTMPVRVMRYDLGGYEKQIRYLREQNRGRSDLTGGEYLSGISKKDRLKAVITSVIYCGKEWDGPRSLHEMLDIDDTMENIRKWIPDYPLHVIEARKEPDWRLFHSDLRWLFGYLQHLDHNIVDFIEAHADVYAHLPYDLFLVLCQITKAKELKDIIKKNKTTGGEINMCEALQALIAQGEARGEKRGKTELLGVIRRKLDNGLSAGAIAHWMELDQAYVNDIARLVEQYPEESNEQLTDRLLKLKEEDE